MNCVEYVFKSTNPFQNIYLDFEIYFVIHNLIWIVKFKIYFINLK